jgi:hypothetical protein
MSKEIRKTGWLPFLQKFHGCDNKVTKEFVETFNGIRAQIGYLKLQVFEASIA